MKTKRFTAVFLAAVITIVTLAGCSRTVKLEPTSSRSGSSEIAYAEIDNGVSTVYTDRDYGFQTDLPEDGEQIAILHTTAGDICIRLFPEGAPKTVENFTSLISEGYYDGLVFHRVKKNFMIQSGDPNGNGTGGQSIWGGKFEDEFDSKLLNIRGSLAMANSGVDTNGSQFFINQAPASAFGSRKNYDYQTLVLKYRSVYNQYCSQYSDFTSYYPTLDDYICQALGAAVKSYIVPDEVWELYEGLGGNISLDGAWRKSGGHTVFGQVYSGMDVVDAIAAVETDSNDKPLEDIVITSAELSVYKAE